MIDALLNSYPRMRPELPQAHQLVYEREYKLNRNGEAAVEGLAKNLEGWMHRRVASQRGAPILELGAGTLNHLRYEHDTHDYDIVEPFTALYEESPVLQKVRAVYGSIDDIDPENRYQRIISIAVLEHMTNLPNDLARAGMLMAENGVFQAGIPSEGGFLWGVGWRCTTGLSYFLRNQLDYGVLMRHEHVNTAPEILALVRCFFHDVSVVYFPALTHQLSLYSYIEARSPDLDRCRNCLS